MASESFTSSDQIARDIASGMFPAMSAATKRELAERERVYGVALAELDNRASQVSEHHRRSIARFIAMGVVPTGGTASELLEALKGVVAVSDRKTVEYDRAHAAIAKAEGR